MKMLLHLMAKDFRFSRGNVLFFWICVAVVVVWPVVDRQFELSKVTMIVPVLGFLWSLGFTMTLLLNWIHLDHPLATNGFLQTRPVSGTMRWLPKFLLWGSLVVAPALVGVMLQMALLRLDLRGEDYLRAELRSILIVIGCFGTTAVIAALTNRGFLALALSIPMALLLMTLLSSYNQPVLGLYPSSDYASWLELMQSRKMAAWHLAGLAGFVTAAWLLARGRWRSLALGLAAVAAVCGAALLLWPVNLLRRNPNPVVAEPVRLQELQSQTQVPIRGYLYKHRKQSGQSFRYHSDPLFLELPEASLEWPRVISYTTTMPRAKLPGDPRLTGGWTAGTNAWMENSRPDHPSDTGPIPERALLHLLGLPKDLNFSLSTLDAVISAAAANPTVELNLMTPALLTGGATVPTEGTLVCEWYRPVILAEIPLRAGAAFTQDGKSVQVLEAGVKGGKLAVKFRTIRHESLLETGPTDFDKVPDFHLCIANPKRGEMAIRRSVSTQQGDLLAGGAEVKAVAEYAVKGSGYQIIQADHAWLETARLYVIQARSIGRTEQACRGELVVKATEQKP